MIYDDSKSGNYYVSTTWRIGGYAIHYENQIYISENSNMGSLPWKSSYETYKLLCSIIWFSRQRPHMIALWLTNRSLIGQNANFAL